MSVLSPTSSGVTFPEISTGLSSAEWLRGSAPLAIRRLRAVVLLGGTVRRTAFLDSIARPTAMLPVAPDRRLIDLWAAALSELHVEYELPVLDCRIVLDRVGLPEALPEAEGVKFSLQADPSEFRGTGGVLADIAFNFDASDYILVAPAATLPPENLVSTARAAARIGTEVSILVDRSGRPLDLFLVRCGALSEIPRIGFIDFKEQGIPLVAKRHAIGIARCQLSLRPSARTAASYLKLLRSIALQEDESVQPFMERWSRAFGLAEAGADVAESACLHDSVVLAGASVGKNTTVARSIVCPGGRVSAGQTVVGKLVTASGVTEIWEK